MSSMMPPSRSHRSSSSVTEGRPPRWTGARPFPLSLFGALALVADGAALVASAALAGALGAASLALGGGRWRGEVADAVELRVLVVVSGRPGGLDSPSEQRGHRTRPFDVLEKVWTRSERGHPPFAHCRRALVVFGERLVVVDVVHVTEDASLGGVDKELAPLDLEFDVDVDRDDVGASAQPDVPDEREDVVLDDADEDAVDEGLHVGEEMLRVAPWSGTRPSPHCSTSQS